ncbi:MAG TPA: DUF58 domain-containing protein [Methanocorpusculum sp.]|nr:DUF58 domain-containing protein [Methanocorpusculum sp.]HJJ52916.1 DUF58 domain-containing protein [Methanocorpusculum sp.]HKL97954.1 DUF58 domain-containing protein [Methanocorpusculum sp.]
MRPTRLTGLLLFFALVCFVYAWMMNIGEAAAAGLGILVFLAVRAGSFQTAARELAVSLTVTREADKTILTQNTIVNIRSSITAVTKNLDACFEDVPPVGAVLATCTTEFTEGKAFYSFNLPVIGESFFKGVLVTCSDLFFSHTFLVARNAELPKLTMYPTGISATHYAVGQRSGWSTQEYDRHALIAGTDTRTMRPFLDGDSPRDLDWKLTSKHGKMYVRLRMDASGGLPALVIDLPPMGASEELCIHFAETVIGVLESLTIGEEYPMIFISGAVYLETVRSGQTSHILARLKQSGTIHATEHLFRLRHPGAASKNPGGSRQLSDTERRVKELTRLYVGRYPTEFERIMQGISISLAEETRITYVTAAIGDLSHMTYHINEIKRNERNVTVFVVGVAGTPREEEVRTAFVLAGADVVEMV